MTEDERTMNNLLRRKLLTWYRRHQRSLPWRETKDPYRIWISEIMLQQTQVDTVIPYYLRFLKTFPDVRTLAAAPLQNVLKAWENLGYYSRAGNIHKASGIIVREWGGRIPDTHDAIKKLPGIGDYTAGAILSIAYGQPVPAVDGNVRRILSRLFAIRRAVDDPREQKKLFDLAEALVPARNPGDFNQALMDLGATICKPKTPDCSRCPVAMVCRAKRAGLQNMLPVTRKAPAIPRRIAGAAVIYDQEGRLLVVQRPTSGLLASLWKLPGGFVETDRLEKNLRDSVSKELNISIRVGGEIACVKHTYTHFRATLHAHACVITKGKPRTQGCQNWRWVSPAVLQKLPLSRIDRLMAAAIRFLPG